MVSDTTYTVRGLTVQVPSVRGFQRSYEQAVPDLPADEVRALVKRGHLGQR